MKNNMRPVHPGEVLQEELDALELSANAFAKKINVPTNRVTAILKQQRAITADTALRLAIYFNMTPEFWLNLQMAYELRKTISTDGKRIKKELSQHGDV